MFGGKGPVMLGEVGDCESYPPDTAQAPSSEPSRFERPFEQIAGCP